MGANPACFMELPVKWGFVGFEDLKDKGWLGKEIRMGSRPVPEDVVGVRPIISNLNMFQGTFKECSSGFANITLCPVIYEEQRAHLD